MHRRRPRSVARLLLFALVSAMVLLLLRLAPSKSSSNTPSSELLGLHLAPQARSGRVAARRYTQEEPHQRRAPSQLRPQQRRWNGGIDQRLSPALHVDLATPRSSRILRANAGAPPPPNKKRVTVVGGTGYIGKFVVKELADRGYDVTAVVREKSGVGGKANLDQVRGDFPEGVKVIAGDVTNKESLDSIMPDTDVVVSCLASRTGGIQDSWSIDYEATKNSMDSAKGKGAKQFVLLSAICVQKPLLEFQRAKLRFEEELMASGMEYSIVRPTAFFKSLAGQIENVKNGGPYVMFGDGQLAACKPISERDLASYMADCITNPELQNKILPIGGPGEALTPLQQSEILFNAAGVEPNTIKVPIQIMDGAIWVFDQLAKVFKNLEDAAEFAKIGRYYAAESMLLQDETGAYNADITPSYGKDTLEDFFKNSVKNGLKGQELGDQAVFGINKRE